MTTGLKTRQRRTAIDPAERLAVASRQSLGDDIYELLLSQLISLKISPGSRIAIAALVHDLGVSQTPIRAALIRLENEGLVVKTHNVGYSAAPMPTRDKFVEIFDLRLLLEPHAAAKVAENLTDESRTRLEQAAAPMIESASKDAKVAYSKFAVQDAHFHEVIAREGGNKLIEEALSRAYAHAHLFRLRFHPVVTEEAITEHAQIVSAIISGNPQAARKAMENHIICSRGRMQPFFEEIE